MNQFKRTHEIFAIVCFGAVLATIPYFLTHSSERTEVPTTTTLLVGFAAVSHIVPLVNLLSVLAMAVAIMN